MSRNLRNRGAELTLIRKSGSVALPGDFPQNRAMRRHAAKQAKTSQIRTPGKSSKPNRENL